MKEAEKINQIEALVERLFTSPVQAPGRTRAEQAQWWRQCYCPRDRESQVFVKEFLEDASTSICRITGQIGAGKTSFVLDKLENPENRVCDGLVIDIGLHAARLAQAQAEAYREYSRLFAGESAPPVRSRDWGDQCVATELHRIIAESIERRFREHFWALRCGLSSDYFDIDVYHMVNVDCPEPSLDDYELYSMTALSRLKSEGVARRWNF